MVLRKLYSYMSKNETGALPNTIHKNKLKMDWRSNARPDTIKLLEENIGRILFDINHSQIPFNHLLEK